MSLDRLEFGAVTVDLRRAEVRRVGEAVALEEELFEPSTSLQDVYRVQLSLRYSFE